MSGKTHTVLGDRDEVGNGFIPRALSELFHPLEEIKVQVSKFYDRKFEYEVRVQFFELYGEEIRNLLALSKLSNDRKYGDNISRNISQRRKKPKVQVKVRDIGEDELKIVGANEHRISRRDEGIKLFFERFERRVTAATKMNSESSRLHAIFFFARSTNVATISYNG